MHCEAIMEKSHSRSSTKHAPQRDDPFPINLAVKRSGNSQAKRNPVPDKPSREDISRCINIWASMYLTDHEETGKRNLALPSRPWLGRNPSSLKPFE